MLTHDRFFFIAANLALQCLLSGKIAEHGVHAAAQKEGKRSARTSTDNQMWETATSDATLAASIGESVTDTTEPTGMVVTGALVSDSDLSDSDSTIPYTSEPVQAKESITILSATDPSDIKAPMPTGSYVGNSDVDCKLSPVSVDCRTIRKNATKAHMDSRVIDASSRDTWVSSDRPLAFPARTMTFEEVSQDFLENLYPAILTCPTLSCRGRCTESFFLEAELELLTCNCDYLCIYFGDCCADYIEHCLPKDDEYPVKDVIRNIKLKSIVSVFKDYPDMVCTQFYTHDLSRPSMCSSYVAAEVRNIRIFGTCETYFSKEKIEKCEDRSIPGLVYNVPVPMKRYFQRNKFCLPCNHYSSDEQPLRVIVHCPGGRHFENLFAAEDDLNILRQYKEEWDKCQFSITSEALEQKRLLMRHQCVTEFEDTKKLCTVADNDYKPLCYGTKMPIAAFNTITKRRTIAANIFCIGCLIPSEVITHSLICNSSFAEESKKAGIQTEDMPRLTIHAYIEVKVEHNKHGSRIRDEKGVWKHHCPSRFAVDIVNERCVPFSHPEWFDRPTATGKVRWTNLFSAYISLASKPNKTTTEVIAQLQASVHRKVANITGAILLDMTTTHIPACRSAFCQKMISMSVIKKNAYYIKLATFLVKNSMLPLFVEEGAVLAKAIRTSYNQIIPGKWSLYFTEQFLDQDAAYTEENDNGTSIVPNITLTTNLRILQKHNRSGPVILANSHDAEEDLSNFFLTIIGKTVLSYEASQIVGVAVEVIDFRVYFQNCQLEILTCPSREFSSNDVRIKGNCVYFRDTCLTPGTYRFLENRNLIICESYVPPPTKSEVSEVKLISYVSISSIVYAVGVLFISVVKSIRGSRCLFDMEMIFVKWSLLLVNTLSLIDEVMTFENSSSCLTFTAFKQLSWLALLASTNTLGYRLAHGLVLNEPASQSKKILKDVIYLVVCPSTIVLISLSLTYSGVAQTYFSIHCWLSRPVMLAFLAIPAGLSFLFSTLTYAAVTWKSRVENKGMGIKNLTYSIILLIHVSVASRILADQVSANFCYLGNVMNVAIATLLLVMALGRKTSVVLGHKPCTRSNTISSDTTAEGHRSITRSNTVSSDVKSNSSGSFRQHQ